MPGNSTDAFINNGGNPKLDGFQATARSLKLGANVSDSGSLAVTGANGFLSVGPCSGCNGSSSEGSIYVGDGGSGTLSITNGGKVISDGYAYIALLGGDVVNSNGAVTVDGVGSSWTLNGQLPRLFIGGNNTNTLEGGTALLRVTNGGTVIVNSLNNDVLIPFNVGISGTLTGNGTITANGRATLQSRLVNVRGTLAPEGTFHINGNLALANTATMLCNITPDAADNADVSGQAIVGGYLSVTMDGVFTRAITRYTLLNAGGGRTFTFSRGVSIKRCESRVS